MKEGKDKILNYITDNGEVTILLYGDIETWGVNAKDFVIELKELEATHKKINLRINSCGGSVFEGMAICNAIRSSSSEIVIYIDGLAASMASVIALCGRKVYMSQYAQLMIHCVSGYVSGTTKEIETRLEEMKKLEDLIIKMYSVRTGMTEEVIKSTYMDGLDHWLSAQEALNLKLVDEVYNSDDEIKNPEDRSNVFKHYQNKILTLNKNEEMSSLFNELKNQDIFKAIEDEAAMLKKIEDLIEKAGQVEQLKEKIKEMEAAADLREIDNLLSESVKSHKITESVAEQLREGYKGNIEGLKKLLNALPEKQKAPTTATAETDPYSNKSWDELDKENKLSELKEKNPDLYYAKFQEKFGKK